MFFYFRCKKLFNIYISN